MSTTLLILAAGMGSRYGGLKQLDTIGEGGRNLLEYSIYDAIKVGFTDIVIIIRKDFENEFKSKIASRFDTKIKVSYAFQDIKELPGNFSCPRERIKPWGTTHAIWSARKLLVNPFAVINADDFYGRNAFKVIHDFLYRIDNYSTTTNKIPSGIVTYLLNKTLSDQGSVNRGICKIQKSKLIKVEEHFNINLQTNRAITGKNKLGEIVELAESDKVSMNLWGFAPEIIPLLESQFLEFLRKDLYIENSECYIPNTVDFLLEKGEITCEAFETTSQWLGITYPKDKEIIKDRLKKIHNSEKYFK